MSKRAKRFFDPLVTIRGMIAAGIVIGLLVATLDLWDWIEPVTGLATLGVAIAIWWQTRRAKEAVYADRGEGSWVVALQVGRPVSEAVKKQFDRLDVLVDVKATVGTSTLALPEHYERMTRAVYAALCAGQGKNIHLVLSGPVALSCLIGQLVGLFHFQVTVYQFSPATGTYEPMPRPTRDWLEHR